MAFFRTEVLAFVLQLAVFSAVFNSVRSDWSDYNDNCPDLARSLGKGCSINDDCTKITCSVGGLDKDTTVIIKINKCDEPVTVDVTVKVPDLGIDWTHNFPSGAVVGVPGFTLASLAGVFVKVELADSGSNLNFKMFLLGGALGAYPIKIKLVDSDLPITTYECGIIRWWINLSVPLKIVVAGVAPLVLLILLCTCCCCCCCRRNSPPAPVIVMAPGPNVMTSTKTNVPMTPFVNEPGV